MPADLNAVWAYVVGVGANHSIRIDAIGGTANHLHLLFGLPPSESLAQTVSAIKANSSRWIGEHGIDFVWQEGYGAFSVSASQIPIVKHYIETQPEHHRRTSFDDEYVALLRKHGVEYDPRYVFG